MKKQLMVVAMLGTCGGLTLMSLSWGQAPAKPAPEDPARAQNVTVYGATGGANTPYVVQSDTKGNLFGFTGDPRASAAGSEIAKLVKQLRDNEDEAKKADLTKQLESAVAKYFDEDMKARESELTKLEERLNKLRTQLDRRRKAKADITQLQTKVLVNEAEGLGFSGTSLFEPDGPHTDGRGYSGFGGAAGYTGRFPGGQERNLTPVPAPVAQPRR